MCDRHFEGINPNMKIKQTTTSDKVSAVASNGVLCGIEQAGKDYNDDMDRQFEKIKHKIKPINENERERLINKSCGD